MDFDAPNFLGTEFLLWLWWQIDKNNGCLHTLDGEELTIWTEDRVVINGSRKFDLRGTNPTGCAAAWHALQEGKNVVLARFEMNFREMDFRFELHNDFSLRSVSLPEILEEEEEPIAKIWQRLALLDEMTEGVDGLYQAFVDIRSSEHWLSQERNLKIWIEELTTPDEV